MGSFAVFGNRDEEADQKDGNAKEDKHDGILCSSPEP